VPVPVRGELLPGGNVATRDGLDDAVVDLLENWCRRMRINGDDHASSFTKQHSVSLVLVIVIQAIQRGKEKNKKAPYRALLSCNLS